MRSANVVPVTDNDRRRNQYQQAQGDQQLGSDTGTVPLFEGNTPQGAEDDDAGHVQRPTGKFEAPHLRLAHGVEEKLHVPGGSG